MDEVVRNYLREAKHILNLRTMQRKAMEIVKFAKKIAKEKESETWSVIASLFKRCFSLDPLQRPSAKDCEDMLQRAYERLSAGNVFQFEQHDVSRTQRNLFSCFPLAPVREARFHRLVTGNFAKAVSLLQTQFHDQVLKSSIEAAARIGNPTEVDGKLMAALKGGLPAHTILSKAPYTSWLAGVVHNWNSEQLRTNQLLPVLMDLVEVTCLGYDPTEETSRDDDGDDAIMVVAELAAQAQAIWQSVDDKECCSYSLGSTGDMGSPLIKLCSLDLPCRGSSIQAQAVAVAQVVAKLVDKGADVNQVRENGDWTALMIACKKGHAVIVQVLLEHGEIAVNQGGAGERITSCRPLRTVHHAPLVYVPGGKTALIVACLNGHAEVASMLLKKGADVNHAKDDGWTALMFACQEGHEPVVEVLLGHETTQVDQINEVNGSTALIVACSHGKANVASMLLEKGADVNHAQVDGWTFARRGLDAGRCRDVRNVQGRRRRGQFCEGWARTGSQGVRQKNQRWYCD